MSTRTVRRYIPAGKEDSFFAGLKKLVKEHGIKVPPRVWRIQLMSQPGGTQPPHGEINLSYDDKGGRS